MKTLRKIVLASLVAGLVLGSTSIAEACSGGVDGCGGVALEFDRPYYKPGEVAVGKTTMAWPKKTNKNLGRPGDGPYNVYLRPLRSRLGKSPEKDPKAVLVGTLAIGPMETKRSRVTSVIAEFTVPAIARGDYLVTYCSDGCKLRPGVLSDSQITVVTNDVEERDLISHRIEDAQQIGLRARTAATRVQYKARRALRKARSELMWTVNQLGRDVTTLEDEIERLRNRKPPREDDRLGIMAIAGSILLAGAMLRRREGDTPEL